MENTHLSPVDMELSWAHHQLDFKFEAKTSRRTMRTKDTWFIRLYDDLTHNESIGEAAHFDGLSPESCDEFLAELQRVCRESDLGSYLSSVRFGIETAMRNLMPLVDNEFTRGEKGIPINGLIWMGDRRTMLGRIDRKIADGFKVLKLKIGGIDFEDELDLLRYIRQRYSDRDLELRLDANGAFAPDEALEKLNRLSEFGIHSLEQPIHAGRWDEMAEICRKSPIPIALDEELIGFRPYSEKAYLLETIRPRYIILKPSLCGGLSGANEWVDLAEEKGIGWWATSALESNVGLQGLAIWLFSRKATVPQGLGTGQLYHNNIPSPLELRGDRLFYNPEKRFEFPQLEWHR